jgi:hypothetical protein
MKKTFGLIALLAASAAVTVPAMAKDRNDRNSYQETRTTYTVARNDNRNNDRRNDNFRDRDQNNYRRVDVRQNGDRFHDNHYLVRNDADHCR